MAESWLTAPIVFVVAPACPLCRAPRPIVVRSEQNGDGSVTRKAICRQCSTRFKICVELPEIGNHDFADATI